MINVLMLFWQTVVICQKSFLYTNGTANNSFSNRKAKTFHTHLLKNDFKTKYFEQSSHRQGISR